MSASVHSIPATTVVRVAEDGTPSLAGYRCAECGVAAPEPSLCCRACMSRSAPQEFRAAETGRLYSWTIVHRSYPGVKVPFVSAIVDLNDGLTLKGTLVGTPEGELRGGLKVGVIFDDAGGARDADGKAYAGFHFVQLEGPAQ